MIPDKNLWQKHTKILMYKEHLLEITETEKNRIFAIRVANADKGHFELLSTAAVSPFLFLLMEALWPKFADSKENQLVA